MQDKSLRMLSNCTGNRYSFPLMKYYTMCRKRLSYHSNWWIDAYTSWWRAHTYIISNCNSFSWTKRLVKISHLIIYNIILLSSSSSSVFRITLLFLPSIELRVKCHWPIKTASLTSGKDKLKCILLWFLKKNTLIIMESMS